MIKKISPIKQIFASPKLTIVLLSILIFFLISLIKGNIRYFFVKSQINNLKDKIKKAQEQNQKFAASLSYFQSDFYKEKELRLKFGLKKQEEKVIVIVPQKNYSKNKKAEKKKTPSNPIKWFRYFFRK